jgi:hypothetical protein
MDPFDLIVAKEGVALARSAMLAMKPRDRTAVALFAATDLKPNGVAEAHGRLYGDDWTVSGKTMQTRAIRGVYEGMSAVRAVAPDLRTWRSARDAMADLFGQVAGEFLEQDCADFQPYTPFA